MLVTVLIPTYNQEAYIEQAVRSVLLQTYSDIEILIGDDHSTDGTKDILTTLSKDDSRIKYYRHKKNIGRVSNYHFLLSNSKGDWTLNLDGDDYFEDHAFIGKAVNEIQRSGSLDINLVIAKYKKLWNGRLIEHPSIFDNDARQIILLDGLKELLPNAESIGSGHLTSLYRTKLARQIGFYEHDILTADSESILRIALYGKVLFINEHVAVWRKSSANASYHSDIKIFLKAFYRNDLIREECTKLGFATADYEEVIHESDIAFARRIFGRIIHERQEQEIPHFLEVCKERGIAMWKVLRPSHMIFKLYKLSLRRPMQFLRIIKNIF